MSSTAPTNAPADRALQRDEDAQRYLRMLHELAEMGMGIARTLHRQVTAEPAAEGQPAALAAPPNLAIAASAAFDRAARPPGASAGAGSTGPPPA